MTSTESDLYQSILKIIEDPKNGPHVTLTSLSEQLGISTRRIKHFLVDVGVFHLLGARASSSQGNATYTEDDYIAVMKSFMEEYGERGSEAQYRKHQGTAEVRPGVPWPSIAAIHKSYGWNALKVKAGAKEILYASHREPDVSEATIKSFIDRYVAWADKESVRPSARGYNEWASGRKNAPSMDLIMYRGLLPYMSEVRGQLFLERMQAAQVAA